MKLHDAIKAVAPHATKDRTLRALEGVMIQDGYALATDRYTIARAKIDATEYSQEYPAALLEGTWISPEQVKAGVIDVHHETGQLILANGAKMDKAEAHSEFPPSLARLFDAFEPAEEGAGVSSILFNQGFSKKYDPRHFPKARRYNHTWRFEFDKRGPLKPVRVTFQDHPDYESLWVPIRDAS